MKKTTQIATIPAIADAATEVKPLANINGVYVHPETPITWLISANPKRPSGKAYARFATYMESSTVADYLNAGGTLADLKYDASRAYLSI
jgi:hypothetical protein